MKKRKHPVSSDERRQQIIDATVKHVIDKGFHRASMAEIAKTAQLSVGQIYRYFANKEDIICALVEQMTATHLEFMADFLEKDNWLDRHFAEDLPERRQYRALNAEINAEALRTEKIAAIQLQAHKTLQQRAIQLVKLRYKLDNEEDIKARVEMLASLTEGMLLRWEYIERPFSLETQTLYKTIINQLLPD